MSRKRHGRKGPRFYSRSEARQINRDKGHRETHYRRESCNETLKNTATPTPRLSWVSLPWLNCKCPFLLFLSGSRLFSSLPPPLPPTRPTPSILLLYGIFFCLPPFLVLFRAHPAGSSLLPPALPLKFSHGRIARFRRLTGGEGDAGNSRR